MKKTKPTTIIEHCTFNCQPEDHEAYVERVKAMREWAIAIGKLADAMKAGEAIGIKIEG